jgi:hypothetical protein
MGNQTNVRAKNGDTDISLTHHQSDSPLLPVAQIERLYQINPVRAEWVFDQTQIEAENRRDLLIFTERMTGLFIVAGLCGGAIYTAYQVALAGHEWPAVAIGCTAPIGLFGAFFAKTKK